MRTRDFAGKNERTAAPGEDPRQTAALERADAQPRFVVQRASARPEAPVCGAVEALQRTIGNRAVTRMLAGRSQGRSMARGVRRRMEAAFGADFSAVRIHEGPQAAALSALAFTEGTDIHFAPGRYSPGSADGQALLGHELTHVVQQSQGRVRATRQASGAPVNDDQSLEREADACGTRAARGERVVVGPGPMGFASAVAQRKVIQRAAVETSRGSFLDEEYKIIERGGKAIGVDMHLSFKPGRGVNARKIGLIQSVRSLNEGRPDESIIESSTGKLVTTGDARYTEIDRLYGHRNPVFGADLTAKALRQTADWLDPEEEPEITGDDPNTQYVLGCRYQGKNKLVKRDAELRDQPKLPKRGETAEQVFETTALALSGDQKGAYYGSVQWGWKVNPTDGFKKLDLELVSKGDPSPNFIAAAKQWNEFVVDQKIEEVGSPEKERLYQTKAPLKMSNDEFEYVLGAGCTLRLLPRGGVVGTKRAPVALTGKIHIEKGGSFWVCEMRKDAIKEGLVTKCTFGPFWRGRMLTIEPGTQVEVEKDLEDGWAKVRIKRGTVSCDQEIESDAYAIELMGGKMLQLPIPGASDE